MPDKLKLFLETLPSIDAKEIREYLEDNDEFAVEEMLELIAESA